MSLRRSFMLGLAAFAIALAVAPAASAKAGARSWRCTRWRAAPAAIAEAAGGVELAGVRQTASGIRADAVLTRAPAREGGRGRRQGHAQAQQEGPDGDRAGRRAGGRRLQGLALVGRAGRHPRRAATTSPAGTRSSSSWRCSGSTHQGRELIALKVTQGARGSARRIAAGGAVLVEPARARVDQPRGQPAPAAPLHRLAGGRTTRRSGTCSRRTELWFVISANPDGYQYTFDVERLWRKNLRDNNGDGQITVGDGVDPNRNFAEHWGYDNEGSSPGSGGRDLPRPERRARSPRRRRCRA